MYQLNTALRNFAGALALLMLVIQGLRWVMSDSEGDRAEAKKGMIYIMVGLIVVYLAANIVCGLYGQVLESYDEIGSCTFSAADFTCNCG
jgi:type IV secretory pathway VirB2 component (pilin)